MFNLPIARFYKVMACTLAILMASSSIQAGLITPDSLASLGLPYFPAVQGQVVPVADLIRDQPNDQGIIFIGTALGVVNGIKVFMPTDYVPGASSGKVDFTGTTPLIGGVNVPGNANVPAKSQSMQADFVYAGLHAQTPVLLAFDSHAYVLDTVTGGSLTGTGSIPLSSSADLSIFAIGVSTSLGNDSNPWGIAQIEFGKVTPVPNETPEPSTVLLTATGIFGLLAYRWRQKTGWHGCLRPRMSRNNASSA